MFVQSSLANAILPAIEYFPFYFEKRILILLFTQKKKGENALLWGLTKQGTGFFLVSF